MEFAARILRITSVGDIPKADRISVVRVLGYDCVVARNEDGSHAFSPGERVIYVPEHAVLPDALLQRQGLWGPNRDSGEIKGLLAGPRGNRVKLHVFRKQVSTGLVWKMLPEFEHLPDNADLTEALGLTKHVAELSPDVLRFAVPVPAAKTAYVVSRMKTYPNALNGIEVVMTEKLEGECLQTTWLGGVVHDEMFYGGLVSVASKGLALQGLCFRDVHMSHREPVVRAAVDGDLLPSLERLADIVGRDRQILLVSEAIGPGVKKLHYGQKTPSSRAIDLSIDGTWLPEDDMAALFAQAGIERAPVLWRGVFDADVVERLREGDTTMGGKHIREGVVARATGSQEPIETELGDEIRPILKMHSDVFDRKFGGDD